MNTVLTRCLRCKTDWKPTVKDIKKSSGEIYKTCNVCRSLRRKKEKKDCSCNYKKICNNCKIKLNFCKHNKPNTRCYICNFIENVLDVSNKIICIHEKNLEDCKICLKNIRHDDALI